MLVKLIFKPLKEYLLNRRYRAFINLYQRFHNHERHRAVTLSVLGYHLTVPDPVSFIWQFQEIFVDEIYCFESKCSNPVIIDCGANIGLSVLYFKSLFPEAKIIAYEADKAIANALQKNLTTNNLSDVAVIAKAVWIDDKGVTFFSDGADGGSIYGTSNKQTLVPSVHFKQELTMHEHIDMLKIDIEGAEVDVLKDCKNDLSHVRFLFIEYHSFSGTPQKLNTILTIVSEAGFRYQLHPVAKNKTPFVTAPKIDNGLDLQLNIFCFRC